MNYYERHLGDYAKDAGHLSMLEHGAYTLLLDRYYTTEHPIPADQAHRVCRARSKEERAAVDAVLAEFFVLVDGAWTNGRAGREITKMQSKVKAAQENGKRGGRPKQTEQKPSGFPFGSESVTQIKAHQSPDTSNQEESASALSARGAVGLALKAAGLDPLSFNLADPRVAALIAAGATPEHWQGLAGEALKAGKAHPWAWVLAVLPDRLNAGKTIKPAGKHAGFATKDYRAGVTDDGYIAAQ